MRRALIAIAATLAILSPAAGQSQRAAKVGKSPGFSSGLRFLGGAGSSGSTPVSLATDTFTMTDGASLSGKATDTGGTTWNVQTAGFTAQSNRVFPTSTNAKANIAAAPASADQYVEADLYFASVLAAQSSMVTARCTANGNSCYAFGYSGGSGSPNAILVKLVGGTQTSLASAAMTWTAGTSRRFRMEVKGSVITCTVDGVQPFAPVTDTSVTAINFVGIKNVQQAGSSTSGAHFDNFSAGTL